LSNIERNAALSKSVRGERVQAGWVKTGRVALSGTTHDDEITMPP